MKTVYALFAAGVILTHLALGFGGYDPLAVSSGGRLPPGAHGPSGPMFTPAGFHGGK